MTTSRLGLPLLHAGQAQKEMFHNEALALLDLAVQAVVARIGDDAPPQSPADGECHVVGAAPEGEWEGRAGALACWTAGGWRFLSPFEGMSVWSIADDAGARFANGAWRRGELRGERLVIGGRKVVDARQPGFDPPAGGAVVDVEARQAIAAVRGALIAHGLIAEAAD